jgi:hypothetical protein
MSQLLFGQEIAEVLSVSREDGEDPSCKIIVHDGKRAQIIYRYNGSQVCHFTSRQ